MRLANGDGGSLISEFAKNLNRCIIVDDADSLQRSRPCLQMHLGNDVVTYPHLGKYLHHASQTLPGLFVRPSRKRECDLSPYRLNLTASRFLLRQVPCG